MARSRNNRWLAPLIALMISGGVGIYFLSMINSKKAPAIVQAPPIIKEAPSVEILIANRDILIGSTISINDLSWRSWPESLLNPSYITKNENPEKINNLVGGIAKMPMVFGEPIIEGKIVQPGERGAMAVLLRKGMRAVSVPISANSGAGGFILPGDFVDIILTGSIIRENLFHSGGNGQSARSAPLKNYLELKLLSRQSLKDVNINDSELSKKEQKEKEAIIKMVQDKLKQKDNQQDKEYVKEVNPLTIIELEEKRLIDKIGKEQELLVADNSKFTEVLLENVRVLAIDQSASKTGKNKNGRNNNASDDGATAIVGATATLEVMPEQAKLLAWASSAGQLTLSLRSFGETLKDEDGLSAYQRVPITRATFAIPLDTVVNKSAGEAQSTLSSEPISGPQLELIRNGRISVLNPQTNNTKKRGTNVRR